MVSSDFEPVAKTPTDFPSFATGFIAIGIRPATEAQISLSVLVGVVDGSLGEVLALLLQVADSWVAHLL